MGEYAEMMLDGTCCQGCGEFLGGGSPGFPRWCGSCQPDDEKPKAKKPRDESFFPIFNGRNLSALEEYLRAKHYNLLDWDKDKYGNEICRVKFDSDPSNDWKLPARVATVCIRQPRMKEAVERVLKKGMRQ